MAVPPSLGKYRLLAELGRGGMATVYLAAHTGPGGFQKLVVVKQLLPELAQEIEFRDMFLDEARLAARLAHPNIVQTYEVVEEPNLHLIVMEYLEGQAFSNVRARLAREKKLLLGDHVRVIADLLEGLHAAHEATDWNGQPLGIVHRDISPHNVFVTYAGAVKIVDFGIAKAATSSQHTRTGVIKGKVSYMAPEQAMGRQVDRRADLFAAGIMLWEAVCARRIWKDMPDAGILHHLATGQIPRVRDFAPDADPILQRVCARALDPDPNRRYATAALMRADIEQYLSKLDPRPTAAAFGALVASTFAAEREKIRRTIEQQMQRMEQGPYAVVALAEAGPGTPTSPSGVREPMTASGALAVETGPRPKTTPPPPARPMLAIAIVGGFIAAFLLAGVLVIALRPSTDKPLTATSGPSTHANETPSVVADSSMSAVVTPAASSVPTASTRPATRPTTKVTVKTPATTKPPDDIMLSR